MLSVALATLIPDIASAWCRMTTSRRDPMISEPCVLPDPTAEPPEHYLEWRRPCSTITFSMTSSSSTMTDEQVLGVFSRSIAAWEAVECEPGRRFGIDIEIGSERNTCDRPLYCDDGGNTNAVMFVWDWTGALHDPSAFAVTTVWHRRSTGEILDADMEINERRGPYGICPDEGCSTSEDRVDLENVVTHEIGHYLGMAHTVEAGATMFASAVAGETLKRTLETDDIEGICAAYPLGSPEGECDYEPRGGMDLTCEDGCGCGCSVPGQRATPAWAIALIALFALRARASRRRS